tara:strand:+ start:326 stop:1027 length:702 start_codon:yes stop_codon:yes gene_type:complete
MKVFIITLKGNKISEKAAKICSESSKQIGNSFYPEFFPAVDKDHAEEELKQLDNEWTYPRHGSKYDEKTGLRLSAYHTADIRNRIGCALSHYKLWKMCADWNKPIVILEHDARFVRKLDLQTVLEESPDFSILGINNPLKATRRSQTFHDTILDTPEEYQEVPWVDKDDIPQGLAGNSAYIMKPEGAEQMLSLVDEHGFWPNDALMCKQLVAGLGVTKTYYTHVQMLRSTTTE